MKREFYFFISLMIFLTSWGLCAQPIVVSDGPNTSSTSSSKHPNIVTTDGPAVLPYAWPPKIITTDGPAELPYGLPGAIAVSDGPNQHSIQQVSNSGALQISDGPGTGRQLNPTMPRAERTQKIVILDAPEPILPPKHKSKKLIAKHKRSLPEPEASALAPAIPAEIPATPVPQASHSATGTILASIVMVSLVAYGSYWLYRRWRFDKPS
jgi:hypothetical protein